MNLLVVSSFYRNLKIKSFKRTTNAEESKSEKILIQKCSLISKSINYSDPISGWDSIHY